MLYSPSKSVVPPVMMVLPCFTVTFAKGMASPFELSVTLPLSDPGLVCPIATTLIPSKTSASILLTIYQNS